MTGQIETNLQTVSGDVKTLRSLDLEVPTRGYMQDIGRGTSHKRKAVKMYLEGFELSEIARRLYHSPRSVARYLDDFTRIVLLSEDGYPPQAICHALGISRRLVEEYLVLLDEENKDSPRLEELRERFIQDPKNKKRAMIKA